MRTIDTLLTGLVARYNVMLGYRSRYRIVAAMGREPHRPRVLALYKREGRRELNVSSWLTPAELMAFLAGGIEVGEAIARRAARGEIPTELRIAAAGLRIGFGASVSSVTEKEPS
jgi:hypothetical protein